ncbi:MAG: 3-oxoacyl-ACP synthase [Candidatus Marinimicrobia bacterium]|nr:3-oxoacyl-ACP synthase [Candidatus Neomarinimicrobiota bacterium]
MKNKNILYANITAVGKYVPEKIITNYDLEQKMDTTNEWITSRTGIEQRRKASNEETSVSMSVNAIKEIIKNKNINPKDIDAIIVATITPDMFFPSCACLIQQQIKATNAWGFDLSAACSGFIFALETASNMIQSKKYKKIIVVGVDTMSSIIDYNDRNTAVLFGDGAGAVLIEPSETNGIIDSKMKIDGDGGKFLYMPAGGSLNPATEKTVKNNMHFVKQDGASVFKNAVKGMTDITSEIMNNNNLSNHNINLFIAHQANKRIIDLVAKKLKFNETQTFINIDKYANTTAATIPIALYDALNSKRLHDNDNIVLTTFGAGFTWGSIYMKWNIYE